MIRTSKDFRILFVFLMLLCGYAGARTDPLRICGESVAKNSEKVIRITHIHDIDTSSLAVHQKHKKTAV